MSIFLILLIFKMFGKYSKSYYLIVKILATSNRNDLNDSVFGNWI